MEHYILKRRYVALFLGNRTTTSRFGIKDNAEVTSRGVVYTLRSVREARVASSHTLRVYYILQSWVFLCLFIPIGCGRPDYRTDEC